MLVTFLILANDNNWLAVFNSIARTCVLSASAFLLLTHFDLLIDLFDNDFMARLPDEPFHNL